MLILSKILKFRIFLFFFPQMTIQNFLNQHKSTKFDTGFRMVHKLSYLEEKKFLSIFSIRGDPYQKKVKNFFFLWYGNLYTIRKPVSNLVDLCWCKKSFRVIWVKNSWKIRNLRFLDKINIKLKIYAQLYARMYKYCQIVYAEY